MKRLAAVNEGLTAGISPQDFSAVVGGPLFRLLKWARLSNDALSLVRQRVVVISLIAWLPLLVLSALGGQLLGGNVAIPFLLDVEAHSRFLIAMPLLIIAELVVHRRVSPIVRQFRERNLVPEDAVTRFYAAVTSAIRLRDSVLVEILLIVVVYAVGVLIVWREYVVVATTTWYATPSDDGIKLSLAGVWYSYVSLPIFQFLLLRWYFRLFVWARFLWQVSRIELCLVPAHPDRVGGLGFLGGTVFAFTVLATAHGALVSGHLANRIFFAGGALPDFKIEIAAVVMLVLIAMLGPLTVFAPQLEGTKRKGLREYGTLAERYVRGFDAKWLRGGASADEELVGSADIQSLADLGNGYEVVRTIRGAPITMDGVIRLVAAVLLPISPLLLTMMSVEELANKVFAVLF
jgi:hypothetical protein